MRDATLALHAAPVPDVPLALAPTHAAPARAVKQDALQPGAPLVLGAKPPGVTLDAKLPDAKPALPLASQLPPDALPLPDAP